MLKLLVQQARLLGVLQVGAATASPPRSRPDSTPRRIEVVHIMRDGNQNKYERKLNYEEQMSMKSKLESWLRRTETTIPFGKRALYRNTKIAA
jgi:hypothetical protein